MAVEDIECRLMTTNNTIGHKLTNFQYSFDQCMNTALLALDVNNTQLTMKEWQLAFHATLNVGIIFFMCEHFFINNVNFKFNGNLWRLALGMMCKQGIKHKYNVSSHDLLHYSDNIIIEITTNVFIKWLPPQIVPPWTWIFSNNIGLRMCFSI